MANVKLFEWDSHNDELILKTEEFALIPEFKNILDLDKKKGFGKGAAWKCFAYMYLAFDNLSPYMELPEMERLLVAIEDSKVNTDWLDHGVLLAGIEKYKEMQNNRVVRMLMAAQNVVEKLTEDLNSIDLKERTNSGGLVYKYSDITKQLKDLADVHEGLTKLEFQVRQERQADKGIRGDNEEGFNN